MHYFVTGATGFVGGYVTSQLLGAGHLVTALVRTQEQARELVPYGVRPHIGTITDRGSMRRGMVGADGVFHMAEWNHLGVGGWKLFRTANIDGARTVFELAEDLKIPRIVWLSSLRVMSDTGGRDVDERHRHRGRHLNQYDRSKAIALEEVALPMMRRKVPITPILAGTAYGPRDTSQLGALFTRYLLGKLPMLAGDTTHSWVHVADLAEAHRLAMELGRPGQTYIVGGEVATLRRALQVAGRVAGRRHPPLPVLPSLVVRGLGAVMRAAATVLPPLRGPAERTTVLGGVHYAADDARARTELGHQPRSLEEGMPDTVRWLLQDLFESV